MINEMIGTLSFMRCRADDDFIDRLNYYYTTTFLLIMSFLVSFKMFGGRPIECWLPAEYKNSWEQYAESYCWAQNTYYVAIKDDIPKDTEQRNQFISYYQWVPFFLLLQAGCFYLPCLLWRLFNNKSGLSMQKIIAIASGTENIQLEERHRNIQKVALYLENVFTRTYKLSSKHKLHRFCVCFNIRYYESFVSILFAVVKVLYFLNSVGQLFFMNWFLQTDDYTFYGYGVMSDLIQGKPWESSGNFPRVSLCDLTIRRLANEHRYTVQCVLVLNIFTEKIFVLLWLWFTVLVVLNGLNLIYWLIVTFIPRNRVRFLARQLELADHWDLDESSQLQSFASNFVKMDGVFVLRMLNLHAGLLFTADLVQALRELYDINNDTPNGEFVENHPFEKLTAVEEEDGLGEKRLAMESILLPLSYRKQKSDVLSCDSIQFPTKRERKFFKGAN